MSGSRWYRVEFYGRPAEGMTPTIPGDGRLSHDDETMNDALLAFSGQVMELFGFEHMDGMKLVPCGPKDET